MRMMKISATILRRFSPIIVCIMIICAYSNTFNSPPVLDDFHSFIHDPSVRNSNLSINDIIALGNTKFGLYRWIPMMTFSLDNIVGGGELTNFHLTNIFIHISNFLVIFLFIFKLLDFVGKNSASENDSLNPLDISIWVASIWALNPVQTNAVTYIVQRMTSLATFFSIASLLFYVLGRSLIRDQKSTSIKSIFYYLMCAIGFFLGMMCKENAAIVPLLILLTETWFFHTNLVDTIKCFSRKHWVWTCAAIIGGLSVVLLVWPHIISGYSGRHFTVWERLLTQPRVVLWYISILIWPNPNRLSLEHDIDVSTSFLNPPSTLVCLLAILIMAFTAVRYRREHPIISYGLLWFLLSLSIESTVIPLELIFEHRVYFPSVGLSLSLVFVIYAAVSVFHPIYISKDFRKLCWSLFAIIASVLSLATFQRNVVWSDRITFNQDNVSKAPNNHRAHVNLAVALSQSGRYREAIEEAQVALRVGKRRFESYTEAANTIILSYIGLNEYERAIQEGERLIRERPPESTATALPFMSLSLAYAYKEAGMLRESYASILRGLEYNQQLTRQMPHFKDASIRLLSTLVEQAWASGIDLDQDGLIAQGDRTAEAWIARVFLKMEDRSKAQEVLEAAIRRDSADFESRDMLEALKVDNQKSAHQETKWSFQKKYLYNPSSSFNICMGLAFYIREKRLSAPIARMGEALVDYALKLRPASPDAHLLKGWYHFERNEISEAVQEAQTALEFDCDHAKAWLAMGFFMSKANRTKEAIDAFHKTLELYPNYPQRPAVLEITARLQTNLQLLAKEEIVKSD